MLFAVVWTWWIGFFLAVGTVLAVLSVIVGYFIKVEHPRFPKKH